MTRPSFVVALLAVAVAGCGGDDGAPTDAAAIDAHADAPTDAAAIDARPIDARPIDATAIDADGDAPPPPPVLNNCVADTAIDLTAAGANRTIMFASFLYAPPCVMIRAGQSLTWSGDFALHPLAAGAIVADAPMAQPGNPIPTTASGTTLTVTFPAIGDWGYYCASHFGANMKGAVYVVP